MNESYKINASVVTHVGKVRNNNEDNFCFFNTILENVENELCLDKISTTKEPIVFGVFDGMGGHEHGEKASFITANTVKEYLLDVNHLEEDLMNICYRANELVCEEMRNSRERIGSTASIVALCDNKAIACNIGDTPIYLYRNHELYEMYEEHTEKRIYERIGCVEPNKKYRLTQNIGIFKEEMTIKPFITSFEIEKGDILLICSDGLTDMVSKKEICSILDNNKENRCMLLKDAALMAGGRDNITILLIDIVGKRLINLFDRF